MSISETSLLDRFRAIYERQEHSRISLFLRQAKVPIFIFILCMVGGGYFFYRSYLLIAATTQREYRETDVVADSVVPPLDRPNEVIYVDLSGAVVSPQTYAVDEGTRLFQLIEKAGGLSPEADGAYVERNYNFSVMLTDQQKVHIPSIYEVRDGFFTEKKRLVTLDAPGSDINQEDESSDVTGLISINDGSQADLESLPGVGEVTAQRIIAGRPYGSVEDLVETGVVKQSLFDKIVSSLEL